MNMRKLYKQAQEMQEKMQRELGQTVVEGSAGGGMVKMKINGHKQLVEVHLEPEAVDPDDIEMLQDLIIAAYNDANTQVEEALREKLGTMAVGMPAALRIAAPSSAISAPIFERPNSAMNCAAKKAMTT